MDAEARVAIPLLEYAPITQNSLRTGVPNLRLRTSTVQGLSNNASFCMETRQLDDPAAATAAASAGMPGALAPFGW